MRNKKLVLMSGVFAFGVVLSGVLLLKTRAFGHGANHNAERAEYVARNGIPKTYRNLRRPKASRNDISRGAALYAENCASCHGIRGNGDGPDGKELNPGPPSLRNLAMMGGGRGKMMMGRGRGNMMMGGRRNLDAYVFWTISEGGEALETTMPAFRETLTRKQRWQIINYILGGF